MAAPWVIAVVLCLIFLLLTDLKIEFYFNYQQRTWHLYIIWLGFRFQPKKKKKPGKKKFQVTGDIIRQLLRKISVDKFWVTTELGTGDAAQTVLILGAIQSMAWGSVALLNRKLQENAVKIKCLPFFDQLKVQAELLCIIRINLTNIIVIFVKGWIRQKRKRKESDRDGKTNSSDAGDHTSKSA